MTIWTVGHSNHPWEEFLELLTRHGVGLLVDVRSSPYSRYASHFNQEAMGPALHAGGIQYLFLGDLLGGRAEGEQFYDDAGRVCYDRVAQSPGFQQGIDRLVTAAQAGRAAIMCGEEDPAECHRRLLVGRVLAGRAVEIMHIRGDGRAQSEAELAADEQFRKTGGQLTLFDREEAEPWKSTRSVLPRNPPPSSSRP